MPNANEMWFWLRQILTVVSNPLTTSSTGDQRRRLPVTDLQSVFSFVGMFIWQPCVGSRHLHVWQETSSPEVGSQQHAGAAHQRPSLEVRNLSSHSCSAFTLLILNILLQGKKTSQWHLYRKTHSYMMPFQTLFSLLLSIVGEDWMFSEGFDGLLIQSSMNRFFDTNLIYQ